MVRLEKVAPALVVEFSVVTCGFAPENAEMTVAERPSTASGTWIESPGSISPTVLILGGFMTAPLMYRGLAGRLRNRGAADVLVANVWPPDWMLAGVRGTGPLTTRSGKALIDAACRQARRCWLSGIPPAALPAACSPRRSRFPAAGSVRTGT